MWKLICSTSDCLFQFLIYTNKPVSDQELKIYIYICKEGWMTKANVETLKTN